LDRIYGIDEDLQDDWTGFTGLMRIYRIILTGKQVDIFRDQ